MAAKPTIYPFARAQKSASAVDQIHHEAYLSQLETAKGLLQAAHDELAASDLEEVYRGKDSAPKSVRLCEF